MFKGYHGSAAWLDEYFGGSCYGMSSTTLLSMAGLLPYDTYKSGATSLHDLPKPTASAAVSSLITYYQMLQVKDVIQQQYRSVPYRSNETNINEIISLLKDNSVVLLGFQKAGWGGHAILAYGYEYGSYTWGGVGYQGCIYICDPNSSSTYDSSYNIYFNTSTYSWTIPAYRTSGISSVNGARFNYIGADISDINEGGYLSGSAKKTSESYIARIDAYSISDNRSVVKVAIGEGGSYNNKASAPGEIIEDYSYILGNESKGVAGYNLLDADSAYAVTQADPSEMDISMDYENMRLAAGSKAGQKILFDNSGFVSVEGECADFSLAMTLDCDHPTDWFSVLAEGSTANEASLEKSEDGYILTADALKDVTVTANDRDHEAQITFSTGYPAVLIYEKDVETIGLKVDADGDGIFETELGDEPTDPTGPDTPTDPAAPTETVAPTEPAGKLPAGVYEIATGILAEPGMTVGSVISEALSDAGVIRSDGTAVGLDEAVATGMKLVLADGTEKFLLVMGDTDNDGIVGAADARLALRASVALEAFDELQNIVGNVDFDESVTPADARLILRAAVNLEDPKDWYKTA